MNDWIIVDTDILIDAGRGVNEAIACLSHGLLIADGLIAATALALNTPFVTKNQRDYRFIAGLDLRPYPKPLVT
jgi:predicted nucleic acid-binding protein